MDYRISAINFSRQYPAILFPGVSQLEPDAELNPLQADRLLDSINPWTWYRVAARIKKEKPDALVVPYWMPFFAPAFGFIARQAKKKGIPVIAVVHNAVPHEKRPGDAALTRYFLNACSGYIVMSKVVEADLERTGVKGPVQQVPHPVYEQFGEAEEREEARNALQIPRDAPVLLFFGFVRRYKGLHVLMDSLPAIREALPGVRLVIAGEFYEDRERIQTQIEDYGLQEIVIIQDQYIPSEAIGRYFGAADLVVQPYISATQSGVAQIAFHFEKPLVVTDVGGLAEIVPHKEAGLVVPPNDTSALAQSVVSFFKENQAGKLTEGIRQIKSKHNWERVAVAVENVLGWKPCTQAP